MPNPTHEDTAGADVADYHPGGMIPGPATTLVSLAPEECVFAWAGDELRCRRPDHDHDPSEVATRDLVVSVVEYVLSCCAIPDAHESAERIAASLE